MRFELLLAKRYISAQRRHSVLTVCSIVIAVALLTALSTCFSTFRGILRDAAFDEQPYHVQVLNVTEQQGRQIAKLNHIKSCTLTQKPDSPYYTADILFDGYIGSVNKYMSEMKRSLKLDGSYNINFELISLDMLTEDSRVELISVYTVFIVFLMFFALGMRMLIDTVFEVSAKERERQFGLLRSIGATPRQVLKIQSFEGILLSLIAVPLGCLTGIGSAYLVFRAVVRTGIAELYLQKDKIPQIVRMHFSPLLLAVSVVIGMMWVFFSAYGTGMRNAKRPPVQLITSRAAGVKRVKKHLLSGLLFGWTGTLAARNARREKKRFVITVLALSVSMTMFAAVSAVIQAVNEEITAEYMDTIYGMADLEIPLCMNPLAKTERQWEMKQTEDQLYYHSAFAPEAPTAYYEAVCELEQSGYFKDLDYFIEPECHHGVYLTGNGREHGVYIFYVNEQAYHRILRDNATMTYSEFEHAGGAIMAGDEPEVAPVQNGQLSLMLQCKHRLNDMTKEQYEEAVKDAGRGSFWDPEYPKEEVLHDADGNIAETFYWEYREQTTAFPVAQILKVPFDPDNVLLHPSMIVLILPESTFRNQDWKRFDEFRTGMSVRCNLKDPAQYQDALNYLKGNPHVNAEWITDYFKDIQRVKKTAKSWEIGLNAVTAMIAMIAVINLVNIVSTGILNRKREFAAMQCSGMTKGQMYRLVVIECLQFTLLAAVASAILCCLLIILTKRFLLALTFEASIDDVNLSVTYLGMIVRICTASAAAFTVTLLASVIPLKRMQKEPLAEQIRAVE